MARYSKKSQYKQVADRVIYALHSPVDDRCFVGHCRQDLLRDVYKDHCRGERYKTADMTADFKERGTRPCLHILEVTTCTKVDAYHHVIAWTKILCDNGYQSLDQGNVCCYAEDMYPDTSSIYARSKDADFGDLFRCSRCIVKIYGRIPCPIYKEDKNE